MKETSEKSSQASSKVIHNITFSQALEGGLTHSGSLVGPKTDLSGQGAVLASHLVSQEAAKKQQTRDTYGLLFGGSSPSAALQSSLGSRLRLALGGIGSAEYALTWKSWDMKWGVPIFALRASPRRRSDRDYGGWGTPRVTSGKYRYSRGDKLLTLEGQADLAGWATPDAAMMNDGANLEDHLDRIKKIKEKGINGNGAGMPLGVQCKLAGWPTATTRDHKDGTEESCKNVPDNALLGRVVHQAGWLTPRASESTSDRKISGKPNLQGQAKLLKNAPMLAHQAGTGELLSGGPAEMASREGFRLNPRFSLWLMGYPAGWACSGERGMLLCRKSRKRS